MIPHTASNSVLSPLPTIHFDGLFLLTLDLPQVFEPLLAKHCQPDLTLLHPPAKSHITTFLCCCLHHNSNHIPERTNTTRCQAQHRVSSIYNRSTWYSL